MNPVNFSLILFSALAIVAIFRLLTLCMNSMILTPPPSPPEHNFHVFYRWDNQNSEVIYSAKYGFENPDTNHWWRLTKEGFRSLAKAIEVADERNQTHGDLVNGCTYAVSWPTPRLDCFV